jgi:hypothetical protein
MTRNKNQHRQEASSVVESIRPGDRVTIITPHGNRIGGRAVMRGPAGWVINGGEPYGTPYIANETNIVHIRRIK